jgi:nucleoside-diphosphate-sugar epimerase
MRIFITGATGFIGKHLCRVFSSQGHDLLALVRPGSNLDSISKLPAFRVIPGTMENLSWIRSMNDPVDVLVHAGVDWVRLNLQEDAALIDAFAIKGCRRLIYFSSVCAGGLDLSPQPLREGTAPAFLKRDFYGEYKWDVEQWIRHRADEGVLDATIVRPTIVYGPGDRSNVFPLFDAIRRRKLSLWDHGRNHIRFCYIGNLLAAISAIVKKNETGVKTYHIGDLECPTLAEMCQKIATALGLQFRYKKKALRLGRLLGGWRFVTNRLELTDSFATHFNFGKWSRRIEADISRLRCHFPDMQFTPMARAVKATARSYLKEGLL